MFCIRLVFWTEEDEIVCKQFCLSPILIVDTIMKTLKYR